MAKGTTVTSTTPVPKAMQIGEVAQRTELSLRTLRHYDEVGLLQPSGRSDGGFRLYTEEDVDKLLVIRRMKPLGFTLEEMVGVMRHIETLLDADSADSAGGSAASGRDGRTEDARRQLAETLDEAYERRAKLRRQLAMADEFIGLLITQLA
jgi:DNA-binding transcriptional MerR regulator